MRYILRNVKDLKIGDKVYIHDKNPNQNIIGLFYLGKIVELCKPFNGFGISQSFKVYKNTDEQANHFISFVELPIIVGEE